ncbi:MAG TPA: hypothetical protein VF978_07440 [Gemmatimonadales bacterium]
MTRDDLVVWLDSRRPVAPDILRERLRAVANDSDLPDPQQLARLGLDVLAQVAARPAAGRELALDLLAADALVTYAFEAQAEADVCGLGRLAEYVARECA